MNIAIGIAFVAALVILLVVLGHRNRPKAVVQNDETRRQALELMNPKDPTFGSGDKPFEGKLNWKLSDAPRPVAPLWKAEHNRLIREG